MNDIEKLILKELNKKGEIKVADIVKATSFSRAYINRFFRKLKREGIIVLIGKANQARYVSIGNKKMAKKNILSIRRILKNINLSESLILSEIKRDTGIFENLPKNIVNILDYGFTEMLNNAIEHSKSKEIIVTLKRSKIGVNFEVIDTGIGIFNNIIKKKRLKSEMEAIQDLLKGKQTTAPKEHTGEGIFFTSKIGDKLIIQGSKKKLIFDNELNDIFIKDTRIIKGTKAAFIIDKDSKKNLAAVFRKYSGQAFEFGKTKVKVALYEMDDSFISRSQARRVLTGLEKFKEITLDFSDVETIGQGFADEVFRVWKNNHPDIKINYQNTNENILFMIKRAKSA